jgi:hypothetical protein
MIVCIYTEHTRKYITRSVYLTAKRKADPIPLPENLRYLVVGERIKSEDSIVILHTKSSD